MVLKSRLIADPLQQGGHEQPPQDGQDIARLQDVSRLTRRGVASACVQSALRSALRLGAQSRRRWYPSSLLPAPPSVASLSCAPLSHVTSLHDEVYLDCTSGTVSAKGSTGMRRRRRVLGRAREYLPQSARCLHLLLWPYMCRVRVLQPCSLADLQPCNLCTRLTAPRTPSTLP